METTSKESFNQPHAFPLYIKCSDSLLEIFTSYLNNRGNDIHRISDSLPLDFFNNHHPLIWEIDDSDPPSLRDFLNQLKDGKTRQVLIGQASELSDQLDSLSQPESTPTTPDKIKTALYNKKASLITSTTNTQEFINLLSNCGYECHVDNIPINRKRVEEADLVILIPDEKMVLKYKKVYDIFKDQLQKNVLLLSAETPIEDLTQYLSEQGEFSGWISTSNNSLLNNKAVREQLQSYAQLILKSSLLNEQVREFKSTTQPDSELFSGIQNLEKWEKKWHSYQSSHNTFSPWQTPTNVKEEKKFVELGNSLSTAVAEIHESRIKIIETCQSILSKESFFIPWETASETTYELYSLLMFRQSIIPLIQNSKKIMADLVEPEAPQGWLPKSDEKELYKNELLKYQKAEALHKNHIQLFENEKNLITKQLIEIYWKLYEEIALLWAEPNSSYRESIEMKLFLRTGYIGGELLEFNEEQHNILNRILLMPNDPWEYGNQDRHFIFMDDFIQKISDGLAGTSIDENLELLHRGTDSWKFARQFRLRATIYRSQNVAKHLYDTVTARITDIENEINKHELKQQVSSASETTKAKKEAQKIMRELRIKHKRAQEHLNKCQKMTKEIPLSATTVADKALPNKTKLNENISRELQLFRKMGKLCNRWNENFIPDVLMEELNKEGYNKLYIPDNLKPVLKEIEELDVELFDKIIIPHSKKENQLSTKVSPTFIIFPGLAQNGFCMEGADEILEGRIALPLIIKNHQDPMTNLLDVISDYRWDSCLNLVGSDWSSSDSIVGNYSRCRWNNRNFDQEVREKSLIYKDESDKKNFRRHYIIYIKSAKQQGRLLYYKNKSIYESLNKHIPLPKGVETLRH